jgi:hypothetical protein
MAKAAFSKEKFLFTSKETSKVPHFEAQLFVALKLGQFGKQIKDTRRVLKCDAGEGCKSAGPIVLGKKFHTESRRTGIEYPSYNKKKEGQLDW